MNIVVVGLSHKTASVDIREKLSIPETKMEAALAHLMAYPHVEEIAIISTCNRMEIYAVIKETEAGVTEITQFLSEISHIKLHELRRHLFILLHQDAIRHLLRVAAGLESLVLGEGQILAQVKHTHKLAQQYKSIGRLLDHLLKQALTAGKRVRSETSIGTGAVSISSAAVELAHLKLEKIASASVSIVGAGKMARLLVQHLLSKGVVDIRIINRSNRRAQDLASQFPGAPLTFFPFEEMLPTIAQCDLVFTSTAATEPIVNRSQLDALNISEMILIDISVPRNVDADVQDLLNIRSFNVDDLKAVVAQNQINRRKIAQEAEALLEEEVESFEAWWHSLDTIPTISCLRTKMEEIRTQELEKALSRLGSEFAGKHQDVIETLTRSIVNKILHEPTVQLRAQRDIENRQRCLQTLHTLFDLDPEEQFS